MATTMTRTAFLKLLTRHLYPVLKAEGFEGSGQTLRRIRGPIVHVFNVQGASGGKACYLNLGAHYDFLPCEGGAFVPPAEIEESHCVFRERIDPPPGSRARPRAMEPEETTITSRPSPLRCAMSDASPSSQSRAGRPSSISRAEPTLTTTRRVPASASVAVALAVFRTASIPMQPP